MVAEVLVEVSSININNTFTYLVPNNDIKIGMRVLIPFGNREVEGFVLNIRKKSANDTNLKTIIRHIDKFSILNNELLSLGNYISKKTLTPLILSYQAMLPKALKAKQKVTINEKMQTFISLKEIKDEKYNIKQQEIIKVLSDNKLILKSILNNISSSSVNTLLKKGVIEEHKVKQNRYELLTTKKNKLPLLEEQQQVFNIIKQDLNNNRVFLLHGVTGSGKTNVYMEVIEEVIKNKKQALVLVPEISLTPQIIKRFTERFKKIAVLHSKLSDGEKYDEWLKINNNEVDIVIGARSAIYAPLKNIGVIIVDEEHSTSYKQENMPRYNAIDIAKARGKYHNCPLILGSATPSLEAYARAKKGVYILLEMKKRANNMKLPDIKIIDMNQEFKKSNSFLSETLLKSINEKLEKREQIILFLNRRGYSCFLSCKSCGYVFKCPKCDISLIYHKTSNMLRCHYCGYAIKKSNNCPSCQNEITSFGIGTEQVMEELSKKFPLAKLIRMDVDTTVKKGAHEKIIKDFGDLKYDILVGTQMIAKGLDFPKVTLVGVINADTSLNIPNFRSSEYTFQLLNQVSGRSGRDKLPGNVIIQTYNPSHYALKYSINCDYNSFYLYEMGIRKKLGYPPFYYLVELKVISDDYDLCKAYATKIGTYLNNNLVSSIILGPSIANPFKINNKYRLQIIIKYKKEELLYEVLEKIRFNLNSEKNLKLEIDFNPI